MKKLINTVFIVCCTFVLVAQTFTEQEQYLTELMQQIANATDSTQKRVIATAFAKSFEETLSQKGSMDFTFNNIPYMGKLTSKDKKVRVFTWGVPLVGKRYVYYGIVQYRIAKTVYTTMLRDVKDSLNAPYELANLRNGCWFGALYYELLQNNNGEKIYYTLLGYDFHTGIAHCKLMDVLTFDEFGSPEFATPLFDNGRRKLNRVLLEYNVTSSFYLNYLPYKKMIVYQKLQWLQTPHGNSVTNVPTDIFDGLMFKDGRWLLHENIEVTEKDFKK